MCRHPLLSWHQHSPTAARPPRCCHQDGPWTQDPQNHGRSILPAGTGLPTRPCGAVLCQAPPAATAPHCTRDTRGNGLRAGKEVEAASTSVLVHAASSRPTGLLLPPGTGGSTAAPTHLAHGRGAARPSWWDIGAGRSLWLDSPDSASQDGIATGEQGSARMGAGTSGRDRWHSTAPHSLDPAEPTRAQGLAAQAAGRHREGGSGAAPLTMGTDASTSSTRFLGTGADLGSKAPRPDSHPAPGGTSKPPGPAVPVTFGASGK